MLDRAEHADGQVHLELLGPGEPAVVGHVEQEIGLVDLVMAPEEAADDLGDGVLEANQGREAVGAELEDLGIAAEAQRRDPFAIRGQLRQPGQDVDQGDELAEGDQVHLVVEDIVLEGRLEEQGRVVLMQLVRRWAQTPQPTSIGTPA